jgi:DNA polymerase-3 subunit delta'
VAGRIVWKNCVGQQRIKDALAAAFENDTLGHAYLFCGSAGVGKFQAALELAFALLCESEGEVPCYRCRSCSSLRGYSHPDFHLVFPLKLEKSHKSSGDSTKLSDEGWKYVAEETVKKIQNPYTVSDTRLLNIPVDWIRELNHSIGRGTIQGKKNVSIICDVDVMQATTANAMLKMLEEPPRDTVIFLLTERPHTVLPTIRSRCQIFRFGSISPEELRKALSERCRLDPQDATITYAIECADGSLGKALTLMQEPLNLFAEEAVKLWRLCVNRTSGLVAAKALEEVCDKLLGGGYDYEAAQKLLLTFLHMLRTQFFGARAHHTSPVPETSAEETRFFANETDTQVRLFACCEKAVSGVRARGNILLILLTFIVSMTEILHGQDKQTG